MEGGGSWKWVGDRGLLREFSGGDLASSNASARALYEKLTRLRFAEVEDLVPAARSLLVLLKPGAEPPRTLLAALETPLLSEAPEPASESHLFEIPVVYGGAAGPDLAELARLKGLSEQTVVRLHASITYTVGFLGFAPGFPYLLGLPPTLATPRLPAPRTRVPAGSVAIGGAFTGIYPASTPGGWRLIGRTEVVLFDLHRDPPAVLGPGDRVWFVPRTA